MKIRIIINTRFLLLTLLTVFVFSSCKNYMEILPENGLVKNEFWKTKEDVTSVLMGAYTALSQMDDLFFKYGEIRADMVTTTNSIIVNEQMIMMGNIYPNNGLCNWARFYTVIDYCNEIIYNAPLVRKTDGTYSDYEMESHLSEAHYIRDLCYFYLVRIFKDVPLVLKPTESDKDNLYPVKTDGDTILNYIVKDLETYRNYAPMLGGYLTLEENKGRVTRGAYDALLADIALWEFDYNACIEYIKDIESSNKYKLVEPSAWFSIFYPGNSIESIFELQYNNSNSQVNHTYDITNRNSGNYEASDVAINYFKLANLDDPTQAEKIRGEKKSISPISSSEYSIWKYAGAAGDGVSIRTGSDQKECGWIMYRFADVLLMKAEAYSQIGNYDSAMTALAKVHIRAGFTGLPAISRSATSFEDYIMEERAKELAYEGKRWFDLMRLGRRNNFARKSTFIETVVANYTASEQRILATRLNQPMGWYLPISKDELQRNMNLVQNPYYVRNF